MKIAVCGGIGSGKSAVIECIDELGYSTRKADDINAELFYDEKYLRLLLAAFPDIQLPDGSVDKSVPLQLFPGAPHRDQTDGELLRHGPYRRQNLAWRHVAAQYLRGKLIIHLPVERQRRCICHSQLHRSTFSNRPALIFAERSVSAAQRMTPANSTGS